ncbi:hypothetical protein HWV62_18674 [Athelia sp. TMB]|nr:hypothetical protein HWV62_18674 [Athelia sp. TMB]
MHSAMSNSGDDPKETFQKLKRICVPIQENSLLSPANIPRVSQYLSDLIANLKDLPLTLSLVSYVFFPLSSILRRNSSADIPDQILEKVFIILGILCDRWWWDCDVAIWDQILMLAGAVVGGIEGKGKGKLRDDETKEAAAQCMWALLRERSMDEAPTLDLRDSAHARFSEFSEHARSSKIIPVIGQTLSSLIDIAASQHRPLQRVSLKLLRVLIEMYAPDYLVPSVLPGIVSGMSKIALGVASGKGWANGEAVAGALNVMEVAIIRSINDDICTKEGAIHAVVNLEDLAHFVDEPKPENFASQTRPFATARTPSWLRGTASQLHIAINTLTPLVSHPNAIALLAFIHFSAAILEVTSQTLPQTQPLLLSFLLSMSNSDLPSVSSQAHDALIRLLSSESRHSILQKLVSITRDNLAALPRIIPSRSDAKTEHIAKQIGAVCRLAVISEHEPLKVPGLSTISGSIGRLLGPTGGIERWGWSLLSVLKFESPSVTVTRASAAQLMLETDPGASEWVAFPEVTMKHVSSRSTHTAISEMLSALGKAGGDPCLFAVEWFVDVGRGGRGTMAVASLWCACRLMEGVSGVSLESPNVDVALGKRNKRLEKFTRGLAKDIAGVWEEPIEKELPILEARGEDDDRLPTELRSGLVPIRATVDIVQPSAPQGRGPLQQPLLHRALALQLISITAGILHSRFTPLLIYTLYPILHSLVSPVAHLSSTALAALHFVTHSTSYASPAYLLLSNFDYALDSVSRRLNRRWLDVDATKVLAVLVRLVGSDVVQKAGDVVEECFDRLDEFHGYNVIVEGLVEVLGEVIKVIEADAKAERGEDLAKNPDRTDGDLKFDAFSEWLSHRNDPGVPDDDEDPGPAPRRAWGKAKVADEPPDNKDDIAANASDDPWAEPPPTPSQALTTQIVTRSLYFLTHGSATIRARILTLLSASVPVLPSSALLPAVHTAWPFILNRLSDSAPFVVGAAAVLIEALAIHVGDFMSRRVWDDVWPRFRTMLAHLDAADTQNALARRGRSADVGTETAYAYSHRLYRALLRTMTAAARGVQPRDVTIWEVLNAFRRFLHAGAHEELQTCARELYVAVGQNNDDAVWLILEATAGRVGGPMEFMQGHGWDIGTNVAIVMGELTVKS